MEENKYYVPEIDEFYVGFEFEEWENPAFTNEEWVAKKIEYFTDLEYVCIPEIDRYLEAYILGASLIRVKYIDKQDLIELGFEYLDESENGVTYIKSNVDTMQQILLTKYHEEYRLGIALHDMDVELPRTSIQIGTFGGAIKNKSELIKVLKMLGIK